MKLLARLFGERPRRYLRVGDLAPRSLLDRKDGSIGAMIGVDPETKRITAIFAP